MNGLTFFESLKNTDDKAIKFLITSYGNNPTQENMCKTGIDYLLTKPFSGEEIEETIIRFITSKGIKKSRTSVKAEDFNIRQRTVNNQR